MKVLQVNSVYKYGSTGHIVASIDKLMQESNIESFVAYSRGNYEDKHLIKIGKSFDIYSHILGTRLFDKHGLYSKNATLEFIDVLKRYNFDIIHLHNIHGYYLNYELLFEYLKNSNTQVVWTLHDCWSFTGHCAHYDYEGCNRWQSECHNCPLKHSYPKSILFDNSKDNFQRKKRSFTSLNNLTIVTPSKWLANELKKGFLSKYYVQVINNGIDTEIFKPLDSDFREKYNIKDKFMILGVTNIWDEKKGFEYFLKLSKMLSKDEVIVMVGLTDKQLQNLPSNIIGIKRTKSQKELAQIYSTADVFVNLTLEDNFPTTNLEAQACGTMVLTFDSGGSGESIKEDTGYIVRKGDLNGIYNHIINIKSKKLDDIKLKCRKNVIEYYNSDEKFKEYIKLYQNLGMKKDV